MYPLKQSTAITVPFFAHDVNGDGVTGLVDGGFTKRISKDGGAWAAMTVTITEMENGWYFFTLSSSHSDTTGILSISFSHASIKRVNLQFRVHARILDDLATQTSVDTLDNTLDTEIADIQSRLPAALVGGRIDANVGAISADATAADNAEAFFDGTGYAGTGNVIPTVTTLTNLPAITANWLTAAGTAADFTTEIQTGLATQASVDVIDGIVDAILVDTAEIGAAGAGLTNIGIIATVTNLTNLPAITANWLTAAGTAADFGTEIAAAVSAAVPNVNITKVNGTTIDGSGTTIDPWGPV